MSLFSYPRPNSHTCAVLKAVISLTNQEFLILKITASKLCISQIHQIVNEWLDYFLLSIVYHSSQVMESLSLYDDE